jgi:hypothetical protein
VEDVGNWLVHSLLMPESVKEAFFIHNISGYDFPDLLLNKGALLETELGLPENIRKRIIKHLLLISVVGSRPPAPINVSTSIFSCNEYKVQWQAAVASTNATFPTCRYVIERQRDSDVRSSANTASEPWETIFADIENICFVRTNDDDSRNFRLSCWNHVNILELLL